MGCAARLGSEWTGPCKPCAGSEGALAFAAPFVAVATSLLPLAVAMSLLPLTVAMSLPPRPAPREPSWGGPAVAVAVDRRFRRLRAAALAALAPRFFRPLESAAVARLVPCLLLPARPRRPKSHVICLSVA